MKHKSILISLLIMCSLINGAAFDLGIQLGLEGAGRVHDAIAHEVEPRHAEEGRPVVELQGEAQGLVQPVERLLRRAPCRAPPWTARRRTTRST